MKFRYLFFLLIVICIVTLSGCKKDNNDDTETSNIPINIVNTINQEDIDKELDIDKLKDMIQELNDQVEQLDALLTSKEKEVESLRQSIVGSNNNDNNQVLLEYILAINNQDTTIIDEEILEVYNNYFDNKPIVQIESENDGLSYRLLTEEGKYTIVSIREGLLVDGVQLYIKDAINIVNNYIKYIKECNNDELVKVLYPNYTHIGGSYPNYMLSDINNLLDAYDKELNIKSLELEKCSNIYTSAVNNITFEMILKDNKGKRHTIYVNYSNSSVYLLDSWEDKMTSQEVFEQSRDYIVEENTDYNFQSINKSSVQVLNNGDLVEINNDSMVIKDSNDNIKNNIKIPEGVHSVSISNEGNKLVYSTDRGMYTSNNDFTDPKLLIYQNGDYYVTDAVWSSDDKNILFWIYNQQWKEGLGIVNIDGELKYFANNLYEWQFAKWNEKDNKIILNCTYDVSKQGILDYKNDVLYIITK